MKKRFCGIALLLIILVPLYAPDEHMHNKDILQVLFGCISTPSTDANKKIEILEMALFLTIDEFNGYHLDEYLNSLKAFGVKNLPTKEQIDFTSNSYHQRATHQGWNFSYASPEVQQRWNIRKELLLSTIKKLFVFRNNEAIKRDSFAALLYYVHILRDHAGDGKRTYLDRMQISGSRFDPTIFSELQYYIERLFREQITSIDYGMLNRYLERYKSRQFTRGTTISDAEYAELNKFADETLNQLYEYIPNLLRNESFFRRAFS